MDCPSKNFRLRSDGLKRPKLYIQIIIFLEQVDQQASSSVMILSKSNLEKIEGKLKDFKAKNSASLKLPQDVSIAYLQEVTELLHKTENNKKRSQDIIVLLAHLVTACNPEAICELLINNPMFWNDFFREVGNGNNEVLKAVVATLQTITSLLLDSPQKLASSLQTFCTSFHSNCFVVEILANKLSFQEDRTLVIGIIQTLADYMKCLEVLTKLNPRLSATLTSDTKLLLQESGFLAGLSLLLEEKYEDEDLRHVIVGEFVIALKKIKVFMASTKVKDHHITLADKLFELINQTFNLDETTKTKFLSVNAEYRDVSNLNILQIVDLVLFLRDANLSFKKTFTEQLMFEDYPFPMFKALVAISDTLFKSFRINVFDVENRTYIIHYLLNKELLIFALMDKLLRLWVKSQAEDVSDLESLLNLLSIVFEQIDNSEIGTGSGIEQGLAIINSSTYSNLRVAQITDLRKSHYNNWSQHISEFDEMLSSQVSDYVRHQRLLQLQKGTWVFAENPLDQNVKQPKVYFLVLSDNQLNLLAKGFKYKVEERPTVENNEIITSGENSIKKKTTVIPLRNINSFHSKEIHLDKKIPENAKLINIINKSIFTEVQLLDKSSKLLIKFYLDTKEASYVWLDGLQLVASTNHRHTISNDSRKQIETLIDLRKNVQLIGLDDHNDLATATLKIEDEEQYYDLDTLLNLTNNFHYD